MRKLDLDDFHLCTEEPLDRERMQSEDVHSRKSVTRFVVDNPTAAKTALDNERLLCTEVEVVQVKLPHRPGEIARVATRLGEANININYAYCGLEPGTNTPLVFFGVNEVTQAAPLLEQAAAAGKP